MNWEWWTSLNISTIYYHPPLHDALLAVPTESLTSMCTAMNFAWRRWAGQWVLEWCSCFTPFLLQHMFNIMEENLIGDIIQGLCFIDIYSYTYIRYIRTQDKFDIRGVGSIVQVNSLFSMLCCMHCMLYIFANEYVLHLCLAVDLT